MTTQMELFINYLRAHEATGGEVTSLTEYQTILNATQFYYGAEFNKEFVRVLDKDKKTYKYYMITFTLDPKKNKFSDELYDEVEAYVIKQLHRTPLKMENQYIVREGSDEDHKHTHWHCSVRTSKSCLKKHDFKYYLKKFGNIDCSRTRVNSQEESINYMSKQYIPTKL